MSGDKSKRNSLNRPKSSSAKDDKAKSQKDPKQAKDKDGDEEMTVVVPPAKSADADPNADVAMNGTSEEKEQEKPVDPKAQAAIGKPLFEPLLSTYLTNSQTSRAT